MCVTACFLLPLGNLARFPPNLFCQAHVSLPPLPNPPSVLRSAGLELLMGSSVAIRARIPQARDGQPLARMCSSPAPADVMPECAARWRQDPPTPSTRHCDANDDRSALARLSRPLRRIPLPKLARGATWRGPRAYRIISSCVMASERGAVLTLTPAFDGDAFFRPLSSFQLH